MKKIIGIFFTLILSSVTFAEHYTGINYASVEVEALGVDGPSPKVLMGKIGTSISPTMSSEFRLGFSAGSDDFAGVDFKIKNMFGAYLKFHPSEGQIKPYVTLGFTKGSLEASDVNGSESDSEDDISFGLGLDFSTGFNLEYMQYMDVSGVELNGMSVGFTF
jgi:hypothetical protein